MPKENIIKVKSFDFALEIVQLSKRLNESKEFILSRQLMRSGTSIGANIREAEHAVSKADFINKMSIALKEATETEYWIELIEKSDYLPAFNYKELRLNLSELLGILISIIKTAKQ